jgi:hypothetical protein
MNSNMVSDGYDVLSWPEFQAFLVILGVDPKHVNGFKLHIPLDGVTAQVRYGNMSNPYLPIPVSQDGMTLYHAPEFKALAARMGLFWKAFTKQVSLTIEEGSLPMIEHHHVAMDAAKHPAPDMPVIVWEEER